MAESFPAMIVRLRRDRKLLQKTVALNVGVDPSYLAKLERGGREQPTRELATRLANYLCSNQDEKDQLLRSVGIDRLERAAQRAMDEFPETELWAEAVTALALLDVELLEHAKDYLAILGKCSYLQERRR